MPPFRQHHFLFKFFLDPCLIPTILDSYQKTSAITRTPKRYHQITSIAYRFLLQNHLIHILFHFANQKRLVCMHMKVGFREMS